MASRGTEPVGDPAIVRLLVRRGAKPPVAERAATGGEILRRLAALAPEGTEYAAAVDLESGTSLGGMLRGDNHEVDVAPLVERMSATGRYILLHTHPAGAAFSLSDVLAFVATPTIAILAAVGGDGTWWVLSDRPGAKREPEARVRQLYVQALSRLRPILTQQILVGALTAESALAELEHQVWQTIAARIGVRYDRSR